MSRKLLSLCVIGLLSSAIGSRADTLHGFCWGTSTCTDTGSNTPTSSNPPDFGFAGSGGSISGTLYVDFLVPTNEDSSPSSLSVTVKNTTASTTSTASLVSTTAFSSGQLDSYLGISASPANPIGAFVPDPADAGATGFYVYQDNLGSQTLGGTGSGTLAPLLTLQSGLPQGSYILGFLNTNGSYSATANSGAILLTGTPTTPTVPEPSSLIFMGTGVIGLALLLRRRLTGLAVRA